MLQLAALLHDADDHKYFLKDSENAKLIMEECIKEMDYDGQNLVEDVLMCISFVSASQNGNHIP